MLVLTILETSKPERSGWLWTVLDFSDLHVCHCSLHPVDVPSFMCVQLVLSIGKLLILLRPTLPHHDLLIFLCVFFLSQALTL